MTKGSYILLIPLPEGATVKVGSLGDTHFPAGCYAYVGSAMGSLASRLNRHRKKDKKPRWHIDYLTERANISDIILCQTEERVECAIAQALSRRFSSIPGFGSSDCKCPSHLFRADNKNQMKLGILAILNSPPIDKSIGQLFTQVEEQKC
jgi:Uri superfamily endonuclease